MLFFLLIEGFSDCEENVHLIEKTGCHLDTGVEMAEKAPVENRPTGDGRNSVELPVHHPAALRHLRSRQVWCILHRDRGLVFEVVVIGDLLQNKFKDTPNPVQDQTKGRNKKEPGETNFLGPFRVIFLGQ